MYRLHNHERGHHCKLLLHWNSWIGRTSHIHEEIISQFSGNGCHVKRPDLKWNRRLIALNLDKKFTGGFGFEGSKITAVLLNIPLEDNFFISYRSDNKRNSLFCSPCHETFGSVLIIAGLVNQYRLQCTVPLCIGFERTQ